ncbi:uncharacterized protein LACBIDRAFT_328946 [Laccaria bicolor S238N-H82]|uniref:Predicted protein n=1 Tax=Laccaria bicolor (strain S238N-H82 / ATCC MYA-4686) TaxID=486041 RepID=B0DGI7_LACBS|nr:uncharacterized protein LACBIDRAFT_328946 [Laccaria bicolor S238N-H82]EDR06276.1 predicted protein [Laccaria bicolor S238N-H82]|eukprot:XP_001883137.1 predicted protein [Laccaria bicolor S238N-H82]
MILTWPDRNFIAYEYGHSSLPAPIQAEARWSQEISRGSSLTVEPPAGYEPFFWIEVQNRIQRLPKALNWDHICADAENPCTFEEVDLRVLKRPAHVIFLVLRSLLETLSWMFFLTQIVGTVLTDHRGWKVFYGLWAAFAGLFAMSLHNVTFARDCRHYTFRTP